MVTMAKNGLTDSEVFPLIQLSCSGLGIIHLVLRKTFRKINNSYPLIRKRTFRYQGVRNNYLEKFAYVLNEWILYCILVTVIISDKTMLLILFWLEAVFWRCSLSYTLTGKHLQWNWKHPHRRYMKESFANVFRAANLVQKQSFTDNLQNSS